MIQIQCCWETSWLLHRCRILGSALWRESLLFHNIKTDAPHPHLSICVLSCQGEFVACLLALLRQMSDRHYQQLLQAFSSKENLRVSPPRPSFSLPLRLCQSVILFTPLPRDCLRKQIQWMNLWLLPALHSDKVLVCLFHWINCSQMFKTYFF